jgi:hypothetical protein
MLVRLGISGRHLPLKIASPAKQGSAHHWKFSKVPIDPRFAHGFQHSVCIPLYNTITQATRKSHIYHENEHVRGIGQGETSRRKYKRFIFGGGQSCDRSRDYAAVVA